MSHDQKGTAFRFFAPCIHSMLSFDEQKEKGMGRGDIVHVVTYHAKELGLFTHLEWFKCYGMGVL